MNPYFSNQAPVNKSFGGVSQSVGGLNRSYLSASVEKTGRQRAPAAGILNAKTLAEENLKGFRLRNLQKDSDLPLRVN